MAKLIAQQSSATFVSYIFPYFCENLLIMNNQQSTDNTKKYLIAIIIILLLGNIFFIYNYISTDRELTATTEELVDTKGAKEELDKLLAESNSMLENYRGKNAELDKLIESKNAEIQEKAAEIEKLLKSGKITARQLKAAKDELDVLRYYVKKYSGQIDSLSKANKILIRKNQEIEENLNQEKGKNENLTMKNITLENKVNLGKKLSLTSFDLDGINRRSSGRETETTRTRRIDFLKISFTLDENFLADLGPKDFYLRLISPEGTTLSSESTGGGTFKWQGEEVLYSMKHTAEFDNTKQTITFYYDRNAEWEKGEYKAEVYADGFLIGTQDIKLR